MSGTMRTVVYPGVVAIFYVTWAYGDLRAIFDIAELAERVGHRRRLLNVLNRADRADPAEFVRK